MLILNLFALALIDPKWLLITIIGAIIFLAITITLKNSLSIPSTIQAHLQVEKIVGRGVILRYGFQKIYVKTNLNLAIDDWVKLDAYNITKLATSLIDESFNNYLKSQGVFFVAQKANVELLNTTASIKQVIYQYFLNGPNFYSQYTPLTLLGYRVDANQEIYTKLKTISIIHLFVISGFHINLWIFILIKISQKLQIKNKYYYLFLPCLLLPYLWLVNFNISAVRAFLLSYFLIINKYFFNDKYDRINLLALTMLIVVLFNPYMVYSLSFLLSFLITYSIFLTLKGCKKKHMKLKVHLAAWSTSALLLAYINENLNLSGLLNGFLVGPIVIVIYFVTSIMFFLKPVIDNLFYLFDVMVNALQYLVIIFPVKLHIGLVLSFYLSWFGIITYCIQKKQLQIKVT